MHDNPTISLDHKAYLFLGEADIRRKEAVNRLVSSLVEPDFASFDLSTLDGENVPAQDVLSAVTSAPFASKKKVVIIDSVDLLSPEDQNKIADFIPKLGDRSCLVMLPAEKSATSRPRTSARVAGSKEYNSREEAPRSGLQPKLRNAVKKHGAVIEYEKLKGDALRAAVIREAQRHGKKIAPLAAELIAQSADGNISVIQREIEKLVLFVGPAKNISLADVENVTPRTPEDRIFPLMDAVGNKQAAQAIKMLNETLAASAKPEEDILRIISMLARHFRMLYQAVFLREHGQRNLDSVPEDLQELLPSEQNILATHDFAKRRFITQSKLFTLSQIRKCLKQVLECELAAKGVEGDSGSRRIQLEMLIMKLCDRG